MNKFLKHAVEEANKSELAHRVGCVIYHSNKIVSRGYNSKRNVKSITKKFIRWPGSIHAEIDAIIKAKVSLKGMTALVIRLNKKGQLRLAKPCEHCTMYLHYVGIKKVIYSTNLGELQVEEVV